MKAYKTRRRPGWRGRIHTLTFPLAVLSFSLLRLVDLWVRRAPDLKRAGSPKPLPRDSCTGRQSGFWAASTRDRLVICNIYFNTFDYVLRGIIE